VKKADAIALEACLPSGRNCLTFDAEGCAKFTVDLSQQEAAKLATALSRLIDRTFYLVIQPRKD
jgi:hypothetical protein